MVAATGAVEVEERLDLVADPLDPAGDHLGVVEGALALLLRVADQPGRAADQQQRAVPGAAAAGARSGPAPGCRPAGSAAVGSKPT